MTADGESNNKSCKSAESSMKRNSHHLDEDAGTSDQTEDRPASSNEVIGDSEASSEIDCKAANNTSDHQPAKEALDAVTSIDLKPELIDFSVVFKKQKFEISLTSDETVSALKKLLEVRVGVPAATQKLLFKGMARDGMSLGEWGLKSGSKIILMGTRLEDLMNLQPPSGHNTEESKSETDASEKEPLCRQKPHSKVIEKGKPADAIPAFKGIKAPLPLEPLSGMLNRTGGKVRLTFKLEADQLWIGTKERTEKVSMTSIRDVISEPIEGHEEYHIVAIQLGPTAASRYWIYWVPEQYVDSIRETILGP